MKKILIILLTLTTSISFAQNVKKCGTQDKLDELIQKDPSILEKLKENREKDPEWIRITAHNTTESNYNYPAIPGFVPTGDFETDKINFQKAKSQLKGKDIQKYHVIIREYKKKLNKELLNKKNQEPKNNDNE